MKKFLLNLLLFIPVITFAGQEENISRPAIVSNQRNTNPANTNNALFDLQFNYTLGRSGFAGVAWTYSSYWVSKWQSDSMFTVNKVSGAISSSFFIPGVTAVRGMAFDGQYIYAVNASDTIYKIDTLSKTVTGTIPAPFQSRGIAFDSSANGGAGGLWVSNYATDITLIDMNGIVLNSILAGTHGLTQMYSIAYDQYTAGGPYIWAFDQGAGGGEQILVRIPVATGIPDLTHNVSLEITGNGIAGGLTVTNFAPNTHSLVGISQKNPCALFGYELSDYVPPAFDASADSISFTPRNTKIPSFLLSPIDWSVSVTNNGANTIDSLGIDLTVNDGAANVYSANGIATQVAPLTQTVVFVPGNFVPVSVPGTNYLVSAQINNGSQGDVVPANDTLSYRFSVTDTVMAQYNTSRGRIGIGDNVGGTIGILFDIPTVAYATSATFTLVNPTLGDSVYAEIFDWNGTSPNNQLARSATYIITAADTNGVVLTLPFMNGPVQMTPASYLAGIHEHNENVTISYSLLNWHPNTTWINRPANGWLPSEAYNFKIVPFIDLNVWSTVMISVPEVSSQDITIYPNPSAGEITIRNKNQHESRITISDISGREVYATILSAGIQQSIETKNWSNGFYVVKIESDKQIISKKILVGH